MKSKFNYRWLHLKESLIEREKYVKIIRASCYLLLFAVGVMMTILNILTDGIGLKDLLTISTGTFSVLILLCFLFSLIGPRCARVASFFFSLTLISLFTVFLISGKPDGFSAIWICLLPIGGMLFFGRKKGSVLCAIMFLIMVLLFWVKIYRYIPILDKFQNIDGPTGVYTKTFLIRFPVLFVSFYAITLLLESIQEYQFAVLQKVNNINLKYSTHDQLTGLFNRKGFYEVLEKQLATHAYSKIGFIIFDLDYFKKLNDTYGHLAGDEVLIEFSELINEGLSKSLAACRWGGEEFLVCYLDDAINKADLEIFRRKVQNHIFVSDNKKLNITVSGGVFETNDKNYSNRSIWLKNADKALYQAKESGRNKIVYF